MFGAFMLAVGMFVEWWLLRPAPQSPAQQKLTDIYRLIREKYVDTVDMDSLIELTIPALLTSLDPHTVYIPASQREDADAELDGSFSGVGIQFRIENGHIIVAEVISGGPSEKVGLMAGDVIVKINDENVDNGAIDEAGVRSRLRGDKGSKVKVAVEREGLQKPVEFEITRGDVPVTSIDASFLLDDGVGYIKINRFTRHTYSEFRQAVAQLRYEGAEDYVLDLRGNVGGYMEPALLLANEFLDAGDGIVSTRGRNERDNESVTADGTGSLKDARVVVLIDELTASASEILSGALQDNDRGLLMGRRTFGKGLVQQPITLKDGSEVRLTIQRYYTPSGRCIQKDYTPGKNQAYEEEILERFRSGELQALDSTKINKDIIFHTSGGRDVYGSGGIIPDIFVPNDTAAVTPYYVDVAKRGLIQQFATNYVSLNRKQLMKAKTLTELLKMLPADDILLSSFADYARSLGVPPRWYYLNISSPLIVTQLKALISYDIMGRDAYYRIYSNIDNNVIRALEALRNGEADFPLTTN